jgi:hypothetical protein
MRDLVFVGLIVVFFALTTVVVSACERLVGGGSALEPEGDEE